MNFRMILYVTGKIMFIGAAMLLLPIIVSMIYGDGRVMSFVITMACFAVFGLLGIKKPERTHMFAKEGLMIVVLAWLLFSAIGALPFVISGEIPMYVDAFFETVSGFTTTGSSILKNVEALSESMLFWRSFTHWIGGMGVLVFAMAILSGKDTKTTHIMRAEMPGPTLGKLTAKWQFSVRIMYGIYMVMTVALILLLLAGGMSGLDSVLHAFGAAGTGGFGIKSDSVASYSPYLQYVLGIFMILFGVNFNIYYLILVRKFSKIVNNSELKAYLGIILASAFIITVNIYKIYGGLEMAFRQSFFQVSSIMTTTGYSTCDFNIWPSFSKMILIILMFIGGCAGSTSGGLKVIRATVLVKSAIRVIKLSISPKSVIPIKNDGKTIEIGEVNGVVTYFVCYCVIMTLSVLIVSLDRFDLGTAAISVITTFNNIGPGLGKIVGPMGSFCDLSALSKIVLSIDMLAGRLELYPVLMLFMPSVWRKS